MARIDRAFKFSITFLIVPLAIPAIELPAQEWHSSYQLPVIFLTAVFAYLGAFAFGTSGYLFLRTRKWAAFWFAPVLGFVAGGLAWWLFTSMPRTGSTFRDPDLRLPREVLWPYGAKWVAEIAETPVSARSAMPEPQLTSSFSPSFSITPFHSAICAVTNLSNCSGVP